MWSVRCKGHIVKYGQMKSRDGKSQRREEKKKDQGRECQKKKRFRCVKRYRKITKRCVFPKFVAPEGRRVGSLKRRVRSHVAG